MERKHIALLVSPNVKDALCRAAKSLIDKTPSIMVGIQADFPLADINFLPIIVALSNRFSSPQLNMPMADAFPNGDCTGALFGWLISGPGCDLVGQCVRAQKFEWAQRWLSPLDPQIQ